MDEKLRAVGHQCKVRKRRDKGKTAAACPEYHCDLRYNAGRHDLAVHYFTQCIQGIRSFLETDASGVKDSYDRRTHFACKVIDPNNFFGVHFSDRASENSSILAVNIHKAAVHCAISGDYTI